MNEQTNYQYLAPREGSCYQQYFLKGRNLRAETLFRATIGLEPMTPDEVAQDYDIPVAAVLEAIQYARANSAILQREREADWHESRATNLVSSPPLTSRS
jgi:uncharacterized protein (DUF433 family)